MKSKLLFIGFLWMFISQINAQVEIEIKTLQPGKISSFQAYGMGNLSNEIPLDRINGSPFFNEEWQMTTLLGSNKREKWLCKVKLNLVTNEIHYLDKSDNELVLESGLIKKTIIRDNIDTSKIIAIFEYHDEPPILEVEKKGLYTQVLNQGSYSILKYNKRLLTSKDSLFGTQKKYFFTDNQYYFVKHQAQITLLKKLNTDNILSVLPNSSVYISWIKSNKINLRKEADIITFINYYNGHQLDANK